MQVFKTQPQILKDYIQCFYTVQQSLNNTCDLHQRLPDGTLDIVFNLGGRVLISKDGISYTEMAPVALTGLYTGGRFIQYIGDVHLVGVVFKPGFGHLFVQDSLAFYQDCLVDASVIFGQRAPVLLEQLLDINDEAAKHQFLEVFLWQLLQEKSRKSPDFRMAGAAQQILNTHGTTGLETLQKSHYMSERNFRRKFVEMVGMSPKQYSIIIRLKSFCKRYELGGITYAELLTEFDYEDYSHLTKDFQKIAGTTPSDYFGKLNKVGAGFIHLI